MDPIDQILQLLAEQNALLRRIADRLDQNAFTPKTLETAVARGARDGIAGRSRTGRAARR